MAGILVGVDNQKRFVFPSVGDLKIPSILIRSLSLLRVRKLILVSHLKLQYNKFRVLCFSCY